MSGNELDLDAARWRALLETLPDAMICIDPGGRITVFNPAAERMFGYAVAEVIGEKVNLLMPLPYRAEHDGYLDRYRRTREPKAIGRIRHVEGRRKNGDVFPVELSVSEARLGDRVLYAAVLRDLTAVEDLRSRLRERERFLATLISNLPGAAYRCRGGARPDFEYVTDGILDLTGYPPADFIGGRVSYAELIHPEDRRSTRAAVEDALGDGRAFQVVYRIRTRDGTEKWVWEQGRGVEEGRGTAVATEGFLADHTEQKRGEIERQAFERELFEQHRLADVGAIAASILHDVGNPLAGLAMNVDQIRRRTQRSPDDPLSSVSQPVDRIVTSIDRLQSLLASFREFVRGWRPRMSEASLGEFVEEVADRWRAHAQAHSVALVTAVDDGASFRADVVQLHRVLDNLIKNALEAIGDGPGQVRLYATRFPDRIHVTVQDTGSGIADGLNLFGLFASTKPSGTGLGLKTSKQIVEAHGGRLFFTPCEPGTAFHVELPVPALDEARPPPSSRTDGSPPRRQLQ
jgi:two-component system sensor kinase FixL